MCGLSPWQSPKADLMRCGSLCAAPNIEGGEEEPSSRTDLKSVNNIEAGKYIYKDFWPHILCGLSPYYSVEPIT